MPPTYLGQRCDVCEHLLPTQLSITGIDHRLTCKVELSSTSQANRRLSAMKIHVLNVNNMCCHNVLQ